MSAKDFLFQHLYNDFNLYFGVKNKKYINYVCNKWLDDKNNSRLRFEILIKYFGDKSLKQANILDMASGCGTFVYYGLLNKYKVYGIDPEEWKYEFCKLKAKENGYPNEWFNNFIKGVGEKLPFNNQSLNVISSYQTLEHVKSVEKCLLEMDRVLKKGGLIHIQAPNYARSFFEPHYQLPYFPNINKRLYKIFLKLINRPVKGITSINYINKTKIINFFKNKNYKVLDLDHDFSNTIFNLIRYIARKTIQLSQVEDNINLIIFKF